MSDSGESLPPAPSGLAWVGGDSLSVALLADLLEPAYLPYLEAVLPGGRDRRCSVLAEWAARPSSEFHASGARVLVDASGTPVAGFLAVASDDLRARRRSDFFDLLRRTAGEGGAARLAAAGTAFPPLPETPFRLLSKIAVTPAARGQGLGRVVLDAFLSVPPTNGGHYRLEVAEDNDAARSLYAGRGFVEADRGAATTAGFRYLAMVLPAHV